MHNKDLKDWTADEIIKALSEKNLSLGLLSRGYNISLQSLSESLTKPSITPEKILLYRWV